MCRRRVPTPLRDSAAAKTVVGSVRIPGELALGGGLESSPPACHSGSRPRGVWGTRQPRRYFSAFLRTFLGNITARLVSVQTGSSFL